MSATGKSQVFKDFKDVKMYIDQCTTVDEKGALDALAKTEEYPRVVNDPIATQYRKVSELRGILSDILNDKTDMDRDIQYLRESLTGLINDICVTGNMGNPVSITDMLNMLSTKGDAHQKHICDIPCAVWKQVLSEFYHRGCIKISPISVYNEQLICIIVVKAATAQHAVETEIFPKQRAKGSVIAALDDILIQVVRENPFCAGGEIAKIVMRSISVHLNTVYRHLRKLYADGKLPFWKNPPIFRSKTTNN